MLVKRIAFPVTALGPGVRIAMWTCGCNKRCKGCESKSLQDFNFENEIALADIISRIKDIMNNNTVDGITISGGEPFLQSELPTFLCELRKIGFQDILVYTGYTYETIKERFADCLENLDVLIDGEYIEEKNFNQPLRGSENQRIIFLKKALIEKYIPYLSLGRQQQVVPLDENHYDVYGLIPKQI